MQKIYVLFIKLGILFFRTQHEQRRLINAQSITHGLLPVKSSWKWMSEGMAFLLLVGLYVVFQLLSDPIKWCKPTINYLKIIPNGQCSLLISKLQSFKKKIPSSKLLALSYTSKVNSSSVRTQHYVKQFLFKLYFYTQLCVHVKENASWLHKMC